MILKYLIICILIQITSIKSDDEVSDFDFENDPSNRTEIAFDDFENDLDYEGDALSKPEVSRETLVRQVILNSMKSADMKEKVARVLPILRVMSPDQKLALASLVTSQVLAPPSKRLTLDQVAALFGNNPNTTAELMLPISLDVANMFRSSRSEKGPTAEELRAPYRPAGIFRRNIIDRGHSKIFRPRKPSKISNSKDPPNCELFTSNICLKSHDYPIEQIMSSIRRNKHAMKALLSDFKALPKDGSMDGVNPEENKVTLNEESNEVRRTGTDTGYMCPSLIRYARPQKARATSGQWKYIVNTVDHTQTLRLERCTKAGDTCTYLTDNFKSRCVQVYNYHRLLTWDQGNGLHMDIFKVPTCCSCHIDSYKTPFPPHYANHATTSEHFPGEELEASSPPSLVGEANFIPESSQYDDQFSEYTDTNLQPESTKLHPSIDKPRVGFESIRTSLDTRPGKEPIRPSVESRPGKEQLRPPIESRPPKESNRPDRPTLPKYLEAPKYEVPKLSDYNHNYKRSNAPKPFQPALKRPARPSPPRRRPPTKPVRDLTQSESNFALVTTDIPTTQPSKEFTRKINYNYHPIIDFFKPDALEARIDTALGDSDWRPVTSMLLATERTVYQK